MLDLSVLILAKNEEKNLPDCLASVKERLSPAEIIVIDDFSTDRTKEIAESYGARIEQRALAGDFGAQRRFAIGAARREWIFFLDADERITPALGAAVRRAIGDGSGTAKKKGGLCAWQVARLNHVMGEPLRYGGWFPDYTTRLMPRDGASSAGEVHESFATTYPVRKLPRDAYLLHYTYTSWEQYINKFNQYTSLAAKKSLDSGKAAHFYDIIIHPLYGFFKQYILARGFLDGRLGFIMCACHAMYVFMKYTKFYYLYRDAASGK